LAKIDTSGLSEEARKAVAASITRWQKLPPLPEGRYLLVNIPAYRIDLFEGTLKLGSWRTIVGKTRTPTPEFIGEARAVILNPSWNVPASIVAESVGRLVARRPAEAARRGYVKEGSRYRQKPGPANQLGQMKLEFINPYSIGLHDTPSRTLFAKEKRALSHGCIRVDDPIGFAAALLGPPASKESLTAILEASRKTQRLPFPTPIPVIVGYFTAEADEDGALYIYDDIYRRDPKVPAPLRTDADCIN